LVIIWFESTLLDSFAASLSFGCMAWPFNSSMLLFCTSLLFDGCYCYLGDKIADGPGEVTAFFPNYGFEG
jgi:hypothetical protein